MRVLALCLSLVFACGSDDGNTSGATTAGGTNGGTTNGGTTNGGTTNGGTTNGGTSTSGGGGISLSDYCTAFPARLCALDQKKCGWYSSEAACEATYATLVASCMSLQSEIAAGRVIFDGALAQSCPNNFAQESCDEIVFVQPSPPCDGIFVGQVADGGSCADDADCARTSFCDLGVSCTGTCRAKKSLGQSLSGTDRCLPGLTIVQGRCATPVAAGGSCAGGLQCAWGSTCDGTTCQAWKTAGQSCNDYAIPGSTGFCGGFLSCQHGVCGKPAALGASCYHPGSSKIEHADCQHDLWCDDQAGTATGTCKQRLPQGSPCADDYDCVAGLTCIVASGGSMPVYGQCVPLLGSGETCTVWYQCQPTFYCDGPFGQETCVARKSAGAACSYFFECQSNSCVNSQCAAVC